jgi:predicted Na+-dependent transporter
MSNSTTNSTTHGEVLDVFDIVNVILIFIIMIGVGVSLDVGEAVKIIKQKRALAAGTLNQYLVMPLLLWGFSQVDRNLPLHFRAGMIVVGTCPGGVLSNILCMWLHADPNLSITMTSWTVLFSLGALPLNIYIYLYVAGLGPPPPNAAQSHEEFDFQVDWVGLGISFAAVLGGNLVGILVQRWIKTKTWRKRIELLCLLHGIPQAALALADNARSGAPVWRMPGILYACLLAPTFIAFFWAMLSAYYLLKLPKPSSAAVAIEASVQNTNIAIGVLSLSISQPNLRAESLGVPIAYATITLVQCILFGLFLWKLGWTSLDPKGRNPCSVWCSEYYELAVQKATKVDKSNDSPFQEDKFSITSEGQRDGKGTPSEVHVQQSLEVM